MSSPLKVIFFGTPELAVPCLEVLADPKQTPEISVVAVVTQPDKIGNRGRQAPPPVKLAAQRLGLPVLQPHRIKANNPEGSTFIDEVRSLRPDIAIVIAYGKIVPLELLNIPQLGFLNVHVSLLPRWRGASPIQAALLAGDSETGVTIMKMDEGMDTGPILLQRAINIDQADTAASIHDRLSSLGAAVMIEALTGYVSGALLPVTQPANGITSCGLIKKTNGLIDWSSDPAYIERQIRAMHPWPGAFTDIYGEPIKITEAHLESGRLVIDKVKPAGKGEMEYRAYSNGNRDRPLPPNKA